MLATHTITIVSDENSWLNAYLPELVSAFVSTGNTVRWVHKLPDIQMGDIAFFLGCGQIVPGTILKEHK